MQAETDGQLTFLPPPPTRWWERLVVLIPATAVVGLAALYAVGALLKAAELRGAGLAIRDTLPILPLETILGAGIGVMIQSSVLLIGFGLLGISWPAFMRRRQAASDLQNKKEKEEIDALHGRVSAVGGGTDQAELDQLDKEIDKVGKRVRRRLRVAKLSIVLTVAILMVALLFIQPVVAAFFVLSLLSPLFLTKLLDVEFKKLLPYAVGVQYILLLTGFVVSAFVYPSPLPTATVDTGGRRYVRAELVAITSAAWYVARSGRVTAIPVERIERATFESNDRPLPASTGTDLLELVGL